MSKLSQYKGDADAHIVDMSVRPIFSIPQIFSARPVLVCISLALATLSSPANANSHLNCDAYAKEAVIQQQRNVDFECGFGGDGWSFDYQAHFNWCNTSAQMADLTANDRSRNEELGQCFDFKAYMCQGYADGAIQAYNRGQQLGCGFTDLLYANDQEGHFNWCMGVSYADSAAAKARRLEGVKQCEEKTSLSFQCGFAAVKAQNLREQLNDKCPAPNGQVVFEFPQTTDEDIAHCMSVGIETANSENELRQIKLDECI